MPDRRFALTGRRLAVLAAVHNGRYPREVVEVAILPIPRPGSVDPGALTVWLVRPRGSVTAHATDSIHGITDHELAGVPSWWQVAHDVAAHLDGRVIIAHDAPSICDLVAAHLPDWRPPMAIDTLRLAKNAWIGALGTGPGPGRTATQPNLRALRPRPRQRPGHHDRRPVHRPRPP